MTFLRQLFRRTESANPIRESAAMTTVYLLEMNRRFELFVRAKIEALEGVVTGLEARAAQQREPWRSSEAEPGVDAPPPPDADLAAGAAEADDAERGRMVPLGPTTDEPSAEPAPLPEVALGYESLRNDGDDPGIDIMGPTVAAVDKDKLAAQTDGDAGEDAAAEDAAADDAEPLPPWMGHMGVGAKEMYE